MKENLPVIILRGIVLFPYNEIKLELEDAFSKKILDMAYMFHDGKILIANDNSENGIGIESEIINKIVLPNGNIRITIRGLRRVRVIKYITMKSTNTEEAIVDNIEKEKLEGIEEKAIIRKLGRELEYYMNTVPNVGNSIISKLSELKSLDMYTDIVVPALPFTGSRMIDYIKEEKPSERARMLLLDIYKEEEINAVEKDLDYKVSKELDKNQRDFILKEKMRLIKEELGEASTKEEEIDKLKEDLSKLNVDEKFKNKISKLISRYETLPIMSPEMNVERTYIDTLLSLPWGIYTKDNDNLNDVRASLDKTHNGLDKVKERIIEYLAVKKNTGLIKGPIICLVGPPGVGKTSLAYSIAKALNKKFTKISVGGLDDEAEILGHRRTYIGAHPGKIISGLIKAGTSNPLFLIDEIDKMSKGINGDPAAALLSVLDSEHNKYFEDNYLEEEYDLSNVMFILTANDISLIPGPLKDRLEIIKLDGYTEYEKLDISKTHIIPNLSKEMGIDNISFRNDAIIDIINCYTKEAGVRDLERKISDVIRKVVTKLMNGEITKIPQITAKNVSNYLGPHKYELFNLEEKVGVVNGLAYTEYGGDIIPIESNYFKGEGKLLLTGSLGEVMKESAYIALSYIKANSDLFKIPYDKLEKNDIHIHALEGAIPKEGPSAGITLTTSIISSFTNLKIKSNVAMTGEISLHGDILKIGGLKEKSLAALRNGIDTIIIPKDNEIDIEELPKEVKNKIKFIPVKNYIEVYKILKEM